MITNTIPHNNVFCLYHDDADGRCSAAVVRRAYGPAVQLHAINYGDPIPWDAIQSADVVVIVDFSLSLEDMHRVQASAELIWIDHHKTAFEELADLADVPGLRSVEEAACVLAWQTFFPHQPVPEAVVFVGDRDIWKFSHRETAPFGEGLYQEDTDPTNDDLWGPLLDGDQSLVKELIEHGTILHQARLRSIQRQTARYGFEVTFESYRTLAINARSSGDIGEHIRKQGYEIAYCYIETEQNGRLVTSVTLYSDQVDVSEIALKFGGGGHPGAAGFSFERTGDPFPPLSHVQR